MNNSYLLAMSEEEFKKEVEKVLKSGRTGHILPLATSPLAQSSLVEGCFLSGEVVTSSGRGRAMQSVLRWAIDQLRPNGEHSWMALNFRSYNILDGFYIKGMRIADLAKEMAIAEQTFYRLRAQAIEELVEVLREELTTELSFKRRPRGYAITDRYTHYTSDEQRLVRLAAIFRYPIETQLLHQIARIPLRSREKTIATSSWHTDIQTCIHNLVISGVLVRDDQGIEVFLHPEIREHLLTLLLPVERQIWHEAAAEHYKKQDEYVEAANHFRVAGCIEQAAQLLVDWYQNIRDDLQLEELHDFLTKFRQAKSKLPKDLWPKLKLVAGQVAEGMADFDQALSEYGEALTARDVPTKAEAYYRRGKVFELKNLDESLAHYTRGIELLEDANCHPLLLAKMYIDSAWIFIQERPDLERATHLLNCAERLMPSKHLVEEVKLYNARGELLQRRGKPEQAIECRQRAWMIAQELKDINLMIHTAHNLGLDYDRMGQSKKGLEYLKQSRELAIQASNRKAEAACNIHIGACYFNLAQYEQATDYYQMAYNMFVKSGNQNRQGYACYNLAEVSIELGNHKQVLDYFDEGVKIAEDLEHQQLLKLFDELKCKHSDIFDPPPPPNDRQLQAFNYVKKHGKITNREHRELTGAAQKTAVRDLQEMVDKGILKKVGKGRATRYVLAQKEEAGE